MSTAQNIVLCDRNTLINSAKTTQTGWNLTEIGKENIEMYRRLD
jgi:hypothetical protein